MADFSSGVSGYIIGRTDIEVYFPKDLKGRSDVSCNQCRYYGRNSKICQLNKHTPAYPDKYIGQKCPLNFDKEYKEEE